LLFRAGVVDRIEAGAALKSLTPDARERGWEVDARERRATIEGVFPDARDRGRDGISGISQAKRVIQERGLAFVKEGLPVRLEILVCRVNGEAGETGAALKSLTPDARDRCREGDARKCRAVGEGIAIDSLERCRERIAGSFTSDRR
jgi:hypothetical protein